MTTATLARRTKKSTATVGTPNDIAHIKIRLEGRTPGMLMDTAANINFSSPAKSPADRRDPRSQAEERLYIGVSEFQGKPVLPTDNMLACLVSAGRHVKVGRRQVSTAQTSVLSGALEFGQSEILVNFKTWEIHESTPINAAGSRTQKFLPCFPEWSVEFEVDLDCSVVPADVFRMIVDIAGKLIGLGPKRPERKRMYGRFLVTMWEIDYTSSK